MVNQILKFTWDEWKWVAVIVMLGVVMYWTAVVVEPTYTILQEAKDTQKLIVDQNQEIIDNQNNNTQKIIDVGNKTKVILDNQLLLVKHVSNQSDAVVLQGIDTKQILGNLTQIRKVLMFQEPQINKTFIDELIEKEMRKWITEFKNNITKGSR